MGDLVDQKLALIRYISTTRTADQLLRVLQSQTQRLFPSSSSLQSERKRRTQTESNAVKFVAADVNSDKAFNILILSHPNPSLTVHGTTSRQTILRKGELTRKEGKYSFKWVHNVDITPKEGGSLSALTMWNGKAYSVCRSTGVVYEIVDVNKARQEKSSNDNEDERKVDAANENDSNENSNTNSNTITNNNHKYKNNSKKKAEEAFDVTADSDIRLVPRFILPDGDGYEQEGASAEWMTVKDGKLMVGSSGKEHTDQDNVILHYNECWVKTIDENGLVAHADWKSKYNSMRSATGTAHGAGYIVHETCRWSKLKQLWVFLPRRMACEAFDREKADYTGNNVMVAASEDFAKTRTRVMGAGRAWFKDSITGSISTKDEGSNIKHMGFSAFDFLPGSADEQIFTVKMDESHTRRKVTSVLAMYSTQGRLLMDEITIDNEKITGLVFL